MRRITLVGFLVLIILVVSSVWMVNAQNSVNPLPATTDYQAASQELALSAVYEQVIQSVVNVNVVTNRGGGSGSGFVVDTNGHIVTNNHVVESATFIQVSFHDGTILDAELVGRDPDADLAVIKIDPTDVANLQPVSIADSDNVFVGQSVMAIGSPFGQDFTLTTGIVSALDRNLSAESNFSIPEVIQTDAAINPGNSGGPLLNWNGEVIGVNTAILSDSGSGSGVGFAIPSNLVRRIVPYLIENGGYEHSWLGISGTTLQPAQREALNLDVTFQGVMLASVNPNSPADAANLRGAREAINTPFGNLPIDGDIITAINGEPVNEMSDLISFLTLNTNPSDSITLEVWRDGNSSQVEVTLVARPTH